MYFSNASKFCIQTTCICFLYYTDALQSIWKSDWREGFQFESLMMKLKWRCASFSVSPLLCRVKDGVEKTVWVQTSSYGVLGALVGKQLHFPFNLRWPRAVVWCSQMPRLISVINFYKNKPFQIAYKIIANHTLGNLSMWYLFIFYSSSRRPNRFLSRSTYLICTVFADIPAMSENLHLLKNT